MKQHKIGDSVYYRRSMRSTDAVWGQVVEVQRGLTQGEVLLYIVRPDHDTGARVHISPTAIIDLDGVSEAAGAALERGRQQDRAKSEMLDYLLGELNYYAERDGEIRYTVEPVFGDRPRKARHSVHEIVTRYIAKRDALHTQ